MAAVRQEALETHLAAIPDQQLLRLATLVDVGLAKAWTQALASGLRTEIVRRGLS